MERINAWQKLLGGIALSALPLTLGVVSNLGFLMALSGVSAVVYATGGAILFEHAQALNEADNKIVSSTHHLLFFELLQPERAQEEQINILIGHLEYLEARLRLF